MLSHFAMGLLEFIFGRKFPFKFVYSEDYWMVDIGKHVFPVKKYRLIYEKLLSLGAKKENFVPPLAASDEDVLLVHSPKYVKKLKTDGLSHAEIASLELPYSPELVKFAWLYVGGTIIASELALKGGLAVHIGGGFHHAFPDHGEGFCVLNDVAVAIEKLRSEARIEKAMIVDCDVHQGNGTAYIFAKKDYVFTFSIHQMDIYPADKPSSSLDVGLWSGDGDDKYLGALREHFPRLYLKFKPDIVFYLAGSDPLQGDQLGGLVISEEGLAERDLIVIAGARRLRLPVVVLLAGGYAREVMDSVAVHVNTIKTARKVERSLA